MILEGDCRAVLAGLPERSVQTCIMSPPYFGLRDYGHAAQIGLEPTPDEFVEALVEVFREVRRVLRDDGTVWLNLGDSYCSTDKWGGGKSGNTGKHTTNGDEVPSWAVRERIPPIPGVKPKDLIGIPWMVAFALRADGWYLRSDIIWNKPNPMPESVTDRPTKSHEYVFLLSKGPRYFYDADAVRESDGGRASGNGFVREHRLSYQNADGTGRGAEEQWEPGGGRNKRSVWTVATQPFPGAHFATFPPKLIEPCVLAGSPPKCCGECGAPWRRVVERERRKPDGSPLGASWNRQPRDAEGGRRMQATGHSNDVETIVTTLGWESTCTHADDTGRSVVLDPFAGAGTVGVVCGWHGREHVGVELNPEYAAMARARIALEGRPGGRPAHHEPVAVVAEQLGLL